MVYEKYGVIKKTEYFVKRVNSEHFFKKYQGFGVSQSVLDELTKFKVEWVVHVYEKVRGGQEFYICSVKDFKKSSMSYVFEKDDLQKIVPLSSMIPLNINHLKKILGA